MIERTRRGLLETALAVGAITAWPVRAHQQSDEFHSTEVMRGMATVPVTLGGSHGLRFAIDTAATRSVIAADLLGDITHQPSASIIMHTLLGPEVVQSALFDFLESGALRATDVRMAIGNRLAMSGLDGMLGSDVLAGYRLHMNFRGGVRTRIGRSRTLARGFLDPVPTGTSLKAGADSRYRSLVVIDAHVGSTPAKAIIDSGAGITLLNLPAARAGGVQAVRAGGSRGESRIQSPTGRTRSVDLVILPRLGFSGTSLHHLTVMAGDFHTFSVLGLADEPAILLGLDVLSRFDTVSIDLKRQNFSVLT